MSAAHHIKNNQKRREDACALRKLRETQWGFSWISHAVLWECDASSHRFHSPLMRNYLQYPEADDV